MVEIDEKCTEVTATDLVDVPDTPRHRLDTRKSGENVETKKYEIYHPKQSDSCLRISDINIETYDMTSFPRGVLVIFNIHKFDPTTGLVNHMRQGTAKDARDLKDTFLNLGFIVYVFDDATKDEIINALQKIEIKYSLLSCFTCAILSHGEKDYFYARDSIVKLADIFSVLESPFWVGKPKVFLIQACQGDTYMDSIEPDGLDVADAPIKINDLIISLPQQSDFLYAYSTPPGYSSWRNSRDGSWFIQALCDSFEKYSHELDLSRILTRANNAISLRVTVTDDVETSGKRQIASVVNQLRKDLYFYSPYQKHEDGSNAFFTPNFAQV